MSPYLPDVNVLIALLDPTHSHHEHLNSEPITDSHQRARMARPKRC